jgi:hypothetical protein
MKIMCKKFLSVNFHVHLFIFHVRYPACTWYRPIHTSAFYDSVPQIFLLADPFLASKNNHGSSHPCSRKYSASGCFILFMARQPLVGQGPLIIEASRSHSDTPHSVGLLLTSDQPDAETSTWQHTTLTTDRHPCPRWDSNPQSQQANGRRPTP